MGVQRHTLAITTRYQGSIRQVMPPEIAGHFAGERVPWLVRWIQSYLTNRTATLSFDGEESIPLLKNTKPTSKSGAAGEYYKRAYNVYSVPGSMVGQETHRESTPKGSPTESGNTTARAGQAGGCV